MKWLMSFRVVGVSMLASHAAAASIVHVDANLTTGANDGSSWANAHRGRLGLSNALSSIGAMAGVEVWVADGIYAPVGAGGDREVSFQMKSGVALLGGFVGNESSAASRNPVANVTILTGDLNSNDGLNFSFTADNTRHVVRATGVDSTALIDGFLVRDGGSGETFTILFGTGAGLLVEGGSPRVSNCVFQDCHAASDGAGAALIGATSAHLEACLFTLNRCEGKGSGMYFGPGVTAEVRACEFRSNFGQRGVGAFAESASPLIEDCLFFENFASIGSIAGGGFYDRLGQSVLRRCDFIRNATLGGGGGVYLEGSQTLVTQCRFFGNVGSFDVGDAAFVDGGSPTFVNCLMRGISPATPTLLPDASGCIVHVHGFSEPSHATFINCTLSGNGRGIFDGPPIAAVLVQGGCAADFFNCAIWENAGITGSVEEDAIRTNLDGLATFDHCSVQGWTGTLPGVGNGAFDPLFVNSLGADGIKGTMDDDIRLGAGSVCIDRGSNLTLPVGEAVDVAGHPRFRNDHSIPDTGVGTAPIVDLGCFEFQPPPCAGDANDDGVVDFGDITHILANWGSLFGFADITQTLAAWGMGC